MPEIPFKNYVAIALGVNLLTILVVLISQRFLPPQVPLFYGLPQSEDQLVSSLGLVIPSVVSILIILANSSASSLTKNDFIKKTLVLSSLFATILSVVATIKVILLVGSF